MTGSFDQPVQGTVVALMVLGVVAVYAAVFQLWRPGTAASTRRAWALGAAGVVVIVVGMFAV
jgi:hypothetical protein